MLRTREEQLFEAGQGGPNAAESERPWLSPSARDSPDRPFPGALSTPTRVIHAALAVFLIVAPLTVGKPGMPMTLKADEPAYYLAALSIGRDRDLVCGVEDIRRLDEEFPYQGVRNLVLSSRDGWRTVHFGKPYLVSLIAAPLTTLFGADGFVATNMALLMLAIWLGARYLARWNPEWLALLFSSGFFLLSNAWPYVFWMHSEVLCMAAVTTSLYLGWTETRTVRREVGHRGVRLWSAFAELFRGRARPAWSAAALVVAAYHKPQLALLALPILLAVARRRGRRGTLAWLAGGTATLVAVCALSFAWTGQITAYLGAERLGVRVEQFDRMPDLPVRSIVPAEDRPTYRNSWYWIFGPPEIDERLPPNLVYFLIGRHTGLLLYAPFTLLCLGLFLRFERGSRERWSLLAALVAIALFLLLWIPFNYHGGGGFIGNRYYVNALPAFLFLVTRISPTWLPIAGFALAGTFVGPIVFTPYGAMVDQPTLQAHVRNRPFRYFPLEMTLAGQIPGYRGCIVGETWWFGRRDQFLPVGDAFWLSGGEPVELRIRTVRPLRRPVFQVESEVAGNRVRLRLGGEERTIEIPESGAPGPVRVELEPEVPAARRDGRGGTYFPYRLMLEAREETWREVLAPSVDGAASKPDEAELEPEGSATPRAKEEPEVEARFLVGAVLTYLGEADDLATDLYAIDWLAAPVPDRLPAHGRTELEVTVRNRSSATWPAGGAAHVALSYHWLTPAGEPVVREGDRSSLPHDVAPGEEVVVRLELETPEAPGSYLLELDALREGVAWFSDRRPETSVRRPVDVGPAAR